MDSPLPLSSPPTACVPGKTEDYLWAVVLLQAPATVTLSCGTSPTLSSALAQGVSKLKLPLIEDCQVQATIVRDDELVLELRPDGFEFSTHPPSYNFNAFVAASGRG
jgi:glucan endo-1,3-alpha-glucosidase